LNQQNFTARTKELALLNEKILTIYQANPNDPTLDSLCKQRNKIAHDLRHFFSNITPTYVNA